MATLRSDIIIPEVYSAYISEQTTLRDPFLASGIVTPMEQLNASEGGDFVNVPNWNANLTGDEEVLDDTSSLTPGKLGASKQIGVILHRGRAFETRDLAGIAATGNRQDPMGAIGAKLSAYIAHQKQKALYNTLAGCFGALTGGDTPALDDLRITEDTPVALDPGVVAAAQNTLGDQGEKLSVIAMHSTIYYGLVERRAIDYVTASEAGITPDSAMPDAFGGSMRGAYEGEFRVPTYCGKTVIVSDDITNDGTNYAVYFFQPGSVGSGVQNEMLVESDRDILAKSSAMSYDAHYCLHPRGVKYAVSTVNPSNTVLATVGSWSKVFETKNIGIARATCIATI